MKRRMLAALAIALATGVPQYAWAETCADLRAASIPEVTVTAADPIAADAPLVSREGAPVAAVDAPFCRVQGRIETEIGFELWLPLRPKWSGRLLAAGVGGEVGTFNLADMARGVRRGYAAASTDTGHRLDDVDWAFGRPDRRANFAARANHLLAEKAKLLVVAYYGARPRRSYFIGSSGGSREGLKKVQAYPQDFDGVLMGGAGPDQLAVSMRLLWSQYVVGPRVAPLVDDTVWARVSAAAIAACDGDDGVVDGVIGKPLACRFDPRSRLCPAGGAGCLTEDRMAPVRALYAPLVDETGRALDRGVLPGVRITLAPRPAFAFSLFGKIDHGDANWNPATLNIAGDLAAARQAWPDLPNDDTDLAPFRARGGKIIHYHGWMDPGSWRSSRSSIIAPSASGWAGPTTSTVSTWCRAWGIAAAAPAPTGSAGQEGSTAPRSIPCTTCSPGSSAGWSTAARRPGSSPRTSSKTVPPIPGRSAPTQRRPSIAGVGSRLSHPASLQEGPAMTDRSRLPLAGIRVIDLTHAYTGPFATYHLALIGAEVIKVEAPGGDEFRHWRKTTFAQPMRANGRSYSI